MHHPIYLASIALEPHRWQRHLPPRLALSEWLDRIAAADFDGVELFEPHYLTASPEERARIRLHALPQPIFNTYLNLSAADAAARHAVADAITETHARAFKFNFGRTRENVLEQIPLLLDFLEKLPEGVEAWCECHADTGVETPIAAAELLRPLPDRIKIMVHPFQFAPSDLSAWMEQLGPRVVHAHIQARSPENFGHFISPRQAPELCRQAVRILRDHGFAGSFSIEFVEGTGHRERDTPELLFTEAVRDRDFLRTLLAE